MHLTVYEQSNSLKLRVKDTPLIEETYKYTKLLILETTGPILVNGISVNSVVNSRI